MPKNNYTYKKSKANSEKTQRKVSEFFKSEIQATRSAIRSIIDAERGVKGITQ